MVLTVWPPGWHHEHHWGLCWKRNSQATPQAHCIPFPLLHNKLPYNLAAKHVKHLFFQSLGGRNPDILAKWLSSWGCVTQWELLPPGQMMQQNDGSHNIIYNFIWEVAPHFLYHILLRSKAVRPVHTIGEGTAQNTNTRDKASYHTYWIRTLGVRTRHLSFNKPEWFRYTLFSENSECLAQERSITVISHI